MPKVKSFLKTISIDYAKRAHDCQHNRNHRLNKGEIRLRLKEQRSCEYYCAMCAIQSLEADIFELNAVLVTLRSAG